MVNRSGQVQGPHGLMKQQKAGKGYLTVTLRNEDGPRKFYVHRLVLTTFVGPCPDGHEGAHENGIKTDNRLGNLRWKTPSANSLDRTRHGTHFNARKTHCKWNHPFSLQNTRIASNNKRVCLTCESRRNRKKNEERARVVRQEEQASA